MNYFDDDAAWEAFRAEAESWLGTPYRHLQRCKGRGADCTLFVGQALLDAGLLTRLEYDYYPRDWHEHTRDEGQPPAHARFYAPRLADCPAA